MDSRTRRRNHPIHLASYRRKVPPRPKDAYKTPLGKGRWIGYLKGQNGSESWCACWRDEDGIERQEFVGSLADIPSYELALEEVRKIHQRVAAGILRKVTVWQICEIYITNVTKLKSQRGRKGEYCAAEIARLLGKEVRDRKIGKRDIGTLRLTDLEKWRDELLEGGERSPATANRILRTLKAALNHGMRKQLAESDRAWKYLAAFPSADQRREVFLNAAQRTALLNAASPDVRNYLTALLLTAARPGELAQAKVADLDLRTRTLRLRHNKGRGDQTRTREFPLHMDSAHEFFKRMAKDKLPGVYLMTKEDGSSWDSPNQAQSFANSVRWAVSMVRRHLQRPEGMSDADYEAAQEAAMPIETVPYTMRHSTISEWLTAGIDVGSVAYMAGTSIAMIDKNYRKFIRRSVEEKLANVKVV